MKKLLASLLALATITHAQLAPPIRYDIESDFQQTQELADQSFQQGSNVEMHVRIRTSGRWLPLGGLTAEWRGQDSRTAQQHLAQASVETVTNTTPNFFRISLDSTATGTAVNNWLYSISVISGGQTFVLGEGRLEIAESSWTGAPAVLTAGVLDWSKTTAYTNTLTHGPVRPDTTTISAEENPDGSITLTAMASAVDWINVDNKPFETLADLTTTNLVNIPWGSFVTGEPWTTEGYLKTVATDHTIDGLGTTGTPLSVATAIVQGAAAGSTALQPTSAAFTNVQALAEGAAQLSAPTNEFTGVQQAPQIISSKIYADAWLNKPVDLVDLDPMVYAGRTLYIGDLSKIEQGNNILLIDNNLYFSGTAKLANTNVPNFRIRLDSNADEILFKRTDDGTFRDLLFAIQGNGNVSMGGNMTAGSFTLDGETITEWPTGGGIDTNAVLDLIYAADSDTFYTIPFSSTVTLQRASGSYQYFAPTGETTILIEDSDATLASQITLMLDAGDNTVNWGTANVDWKPGVPIGLPTNTTSTVLFWSPVGTDQWSGLLADEGVTDQIPDSTPKIELTATQLSAQSIPTGSPRTVINWQSVGLPWMPTTPEYSSFVDLDNNRIYFPKNGRWRIIANVGIDAVGSGNTILLRLDANIDGVDYAVANTTLESSGVSPRINLSTTLRSITTNDYIMAETFHTSTQSRNTASDQTYIIAIYEGE